MLTKFVFGHDFAEFSRRKSPKVFRQSGKSHSKLFIREIVITRAAPAFHKLFVVMGCVFHINTVDKTVEKLTFQGFY